MAARSDSHSKQLRLNRKVCPHVLAFASAQLKLRLPTQPTPRRMVIMVVSGPQKEVAKGSQDKLAMHKERGTKDPNYMAFPMHGQRSERASLIVQASTTMINHQPEC